MSHPISAMLPPAISSFCRQLSLSFPLALNGITASALTFCLLFSQISLASQEELSGVKSEISRQKSAVSSKQKQLNQLQKSLEKEERSIATLSTAIKKTQTELDKANKNLARFNQEKSQLEQTKAAQQQTLQSLIKAYYLSKQDNQASRLLNQADSEEQDRMSHYFQHLAQARADAITALDKTRAQLETKNKQLVQEQQQIQTLLTKQTSKRNQLAQSQGKRKKTVAQIKTNISSDSHYLAELQRNEARLKSEIAKAAKRNAVPMDGLAKQQGRLPWPLKGSVLHHYGTRQSGQVNWKGMVIKASYEQPVKAVYSGTVVFAEYLRGYGLVVLLDHGKGDMTLYGYNQTLLKLEGQKVAAGETIAYAGDSGGQPQASLYFEIRRNSKTQNPKRWLER